MSIDFQHNQYKKSIDKWRMIDHICEGDEVEQYLITLNPDDKSVQNRTRNEQYKKRAVFYQVAGYTARGLNGLLFSKYPKFEAPGLEYLGVNADGAGISIYQQAQDTAEDIIKKGRAGLFVSYPKTQGGVSRADIDNMRVFATIHEIDAEQIINWRTETVGAQVKLSLVVFTESVDELEDKYTTKPVEQIRELALENGLFIVRKWRKDDKHEWYVAEESIPVDGSGSTWSEIPFTFVGSENNAPNADSPPMQTLAEINKGHYRNSADYEDNVYYCGQAQPWMSGINQNHIDVMKENNMYVGSREVLGVPEGGAFGFESAEPNTMVREAMQDKLEMMIGLGARFIQPGGVAKTAQEARGDQAVQHSVLSLISSNLSEAYTTCLKWCAQYMNVNYTDKMVFETTQDFVSPTATAQDIQAMVAGFVQGAIPVGSYFRWLQRHGLEESDKTIEEFTEEVGRASMPDLDAE